MEEYLSPTFFLDFTNEKVQLFCSDIKQKASPKEKAVALYYKVRSPAARRIAPPGKLQMPGYYPKS